MKSLKSQIIKKVIEQETGSIFTTSDIKVKEASKSLVSRTLKYLIEENTIERLSYGKFFIPKKTKYGNLKPKDTKIIERVINDIYKKTKTKPYFASNTIYQKLGLSTQISSEIFMMCNIPQNTTYKIKDLTINLYKFKGEWKAEHIKYLQFLYALQTIKRIPDTTIDDAYITLYNYFKKFTVKDISNTICNLEYFNARTIALVGTMLEKQGYLAPLEQLKYKIGKSTKFNFKFEDTTIEKKIRSHWRIYELTRR
ncbi:MAG: hypothetical protein KAJ49_06425 [Arcobacteraceae bacterium]|nr:hypothetical protein [Arcobacteraceae bacterium]